MENVITAFAVNLVGVRARMDLIGMAASGYGVVAAEGLDQRARIERPEEWRTVQIDDVGSAENRLVERIAAVAIRVMQPEG